MKLNNNISKSNFRGLSLWGMLVGAFLLSACADDHFDVSSSVLGQKTIWENIAGNQNLSEYADILKSVTYSNSETKTTGETYADLLNSDQTFTVWAPQNGTFNYAYYKQLLQSGNRESIYKVEKELIRNNMTRYANIANGQDSIKLDLFNGKAAWLNHDRGTIKSQKMTTPNIGSSNGVLHITDGAIPYQPNVYEFLSMQDGLDSICAFIKHFEDKNAFDEDNSTKGPTVDGKVTWVDSATYVNNEYIRDYLNAYLMREDSNYVMLLPNNDAWTKKLENAKKYFNFMSSYKQDVHVTNEFGEDSLVAGVETILSDYDRDSLNNFNAKTLMCYDLVFNANWQYGQSITSHDDVVRVDSLHNTTGLKFKKFGTLNETNKNNCVEVDFAKVFGDKDPVELSNGYAYVMDEYPYPFEVFAPTRDLSPSATLEFSDKCIPSESKIAYSYSIGDRDTTINLSNLVLEAKNTTSHPAAYFKLRNILSCKYDIYVVMTYNLNVRLPYRFQVKLDYDDASGKRVKGEFLKNPNEDAVDASGASIFDSNYYVNRVPSEENGYSITDTIQVAKDYEFPVSYYGLSNAYPVLQVQSNFLSKENKVYARDLWINAIILKAKEW